jgi:orotidine-5'-phosphate decarboxylase
VRPPRLTLPGSCRRAAEARKLRGAVTTPANASRPAPAPAAPATRNFMALMRSAAAASDSLVCVGLDPEPGRFPAALRGTPRAILAFNRAIVDATADLVCAYKPQIAHYAACGAEDELAATIAYIRERAPGVPVVLDSKRGDIGSTAGKYALEAFERYGADAVTVNPYLGRDAVEPFLEHADKGVVILCRTSNAGAHDFQDLDVGDGRRLYQLIAERVANEWNRHGNCALVVGATWPEELADIRARTGDLPFLVPGVGAQGGDVERAVRAGCTTDGGGLMINSSRGILYAGGGERFAAAARAATLALRAAINAARR